MELASEIDATAADTYRYLNFDQIATYIEKANEVIVQEAV